MKNILYLGPGRVAVSLNEHFIDIIKLHNSNGLNTTNILFLKL